MIVHDNNNLSTGKKENIPLAQGSLILDEVKVITQLPLANYTKHLFPFPKVILRQIYIFFLSLVLESMGTRLCKNLLCA